MRSTASVQNELPGLMQQATQMDLAQRNKIIWDPKWSSLKSFSHSRHHFATKILYSIFSEDELKGKNVSGYVPGGARKEALQGTDKFSLVHDIVFHWWPVDDANVTQRQAWKMCCKAIDSKLRCTVNKVNKAKEN